MWTVSSRRFFAELFPTDVEPILRNLGHPHAGMCSWPLDERWNRRIEEIDSPESAASLPCSSAASSGCSQTKCSAIVLAKAFSRKDGHHGRGDT